MVKVIKYLLLGDPDKEALSLQETALKYFYGGDIVLATTSSEVLAQLKSRVKPELLFVDFSFITQNDNELYKYLEEDKSHFPVITCSAKTRKDDISIRFADGFGHP
jgi:CheY-like chemotaxis protein